MTQEDKELLLTDLCARLLHEVILLAPNGKTTYETDSNTAIELFVDEGWKPYLRPMSSMTEEEAKELLFIRLDSKYDESCAYIKNSIKLIEISFQKKPPYKGSISVWFSFENKIHDICSRCEYLGQINDITLAEIDWLNAHHFDYRELIEKGLAIAVTKENNPYKE